MSISKIKVGSTEHDLHASTVIRNVTDNTDVNIWKVYSDRDGEYGFRLQYDASGTGNNNSLSLVADNQTGTEVVAMKMLQDGTTTFAKTITASISGNAGTATKATQDSDGKVIKDTYAKLSGATFSGDVIVTAPHRDTYYASNLCRHFSANTPNQFVIKTKIKYASGIHMPVIRIYGYAYGLQSPIELRVGFYIYDNHLGWAGVSCTGAWKPEVYLFSYTENSTKYVAVGFKGSCYFCGFQVDAQVGASGEFGPNFTIDSWKTAHNGADTSVNIIPSIGTDDCIKVDYKPMQTDINGTATKATQDGDGNVITSTYAKKSHKHSVTAAGTIGNTLITPAGTVSQPTFTGTAAEHTHTFTGTEATASVKYTPAGTISSTLTSGAHNHTFSGTAVTSGKPDTTNVTTIYSITGVGSLPSHSYTAPSLKGSVENQCLTLTFSAGSHSFNAGSLPTREAISVPNTNHTHSVTASGTIGNTTTGGTITSTFKGTEATISHTFTPAGSISKTSITPAGTVSQPTFTGTGANHNHTFTGSSVNSSTES